MVYNHSMKIAIIGGGFTGLTAAYELGKLGHQATVFEKEKTLGGLANGFRQPNWDWHLEVAYHHLFTNDTAIVNLIKELGLTDKLLIKRPITATLWRGVSHPLDSPLHLLRFPGMPLIDRLRTGTLLAILKINPFWRPLERVTAKQLFLALGGRRAWKAIWEPLMIGKFGEYSNSVAASWLWARIKKRTQKLFYIEGGFHTLVAALELTIREHGGTIHTGFEIPRIELRSKNQELEKNTSDIHTSKFIIHNSKFDVVLLTIPTPIAAKLFSDSSFIIQHSALTIPHLHAQTLILETKEPILKNVYWLNITDRSFPFLAVVAHTNMIDSRHYGGHHLTYFGNYLPEGHRYLSMTSEELYREFLPFIQRLSKTANGKMKTANVPQKRLPFTVYRLHSFVGLFAQPVHTLHYSTRAPKLKTPIPGVFLANMDSIYPWDRGTNYAVDLGIQAAKMIHENT